MKHDSLAQGSLALLAGFCFLASCAPTTTPARTVSRAVPAAPLTASTATAPATPPASLASAVASRPPPPLVEKAMAGDPTGASLSETRLVASSCTTDQKRIDAMVAQMSDEVDAELKNWRDQQPACWEEARLEAQAAREEAMARLAGDSFGSYGLGLSGIGEGGGGRGEAIGLGSIGTIGHGAGMGGIRSATSASKTNNQVDGVDEADIVKTDGKYVYLASAGALRIIEAMNPHVVSVWKLDGDVRDLFVEGDRAVVYTSSGGHSKPCTYGYDCTFAGDGTSTRINVLDVSNRNEPKLVRRIDFSGSLMASRRIGHTVHTVIADGDSIDKPLYNTQPDDIDPCHTDWKVVYSKFSALKKENEAKIRNAVSFPTMSERGTKTQLCTGVFRTGIADGHAFTTVVSFDLDDEKTAPTTTTLQSRPGAVFASANALYLSVTHQKSGANGRWYSFYPSVDEVSEIHKFKLGERPSDTQYVGSGIVPGHVLNQFAMDEWQGYLRVATTRGRVPDPKVESSLSILREGKDHNLVRVGAVEKIAPGEDIRSVRFDGDRGYVVTFKKTDPLFVLDLYDAASPAILGELKIPGFSTYMHRLDDNHLLSIGFDANDHGSFAYFDGVILQLFDVTNPIDPKLLYKEKIGSRGSSSEAATNHLAFNYFAEKHLLAIPMTECSGGGDGQFGDKLEFSGLYVYDVTLENGFKRLGGIDHGKQGVSCSTWWSHASSTVQRSVFLDDLVYSIAGDRVKVQRLGHFGEDVADMPFTL